MKLGRFLNRRRTRAGVSRPGGTELGVGRDDPGVADRVMHRGSRTRPAVCGVGKEARRALLGALRDREVLVTATPRSMSQGKTGGRPPPGS
jgi:hypothetical protein